MELRPQLRGKSNFRLCRENESRVLKIKKKKSCFAHDTCKDLCSLIKYYEMFDAETT